MEDKKIAKENICQWWQIASKNTQRFHLKRVKHSGIFYKGMLYVYGGICQQSNPDLKIIHKYDFIVNEWQLIKTNLSASITVLPAHSHSAVVLLNNMYVFGGVTADGVIINELLYLNLQSYGWKKLQQKGQLIPSPRKSASMVNLKSNILLYGGRDQTSILNDFYIYKFQSKMWFEGDLNTYEFDLGLRFLPGICVNKDLIYVFGGQIIRSGGRSDDEMKDQPCVSFLNDFYEIDVIFRETMIKPQIKVKSIITSIVPKPRTGHSLTSLFNQKYLVLIGGYQQNDQTIIDCGNNVWVYNIEGIFWQRLLAKGSQFNNILFSCMEFDSNVFTFGGINRNGKHQDLIMKLQINFKSLTPQYQTNKALCSLCSDFDNQLPKVGTQMPFQLVQSATNSIEFPFAAFGLLVDNTLIMNAQICNIVYQNTMRQKYLLIQDNGTNKLWQNNNDFIDKMTTFEGIMQSDYSSIKSDIQHYHKDGNQESKKQKRLHQSIEEQILNQNKKVYAFNLKIASLKLGKTFLYISKDQKNKRVLLYRRQKKNQSTVYACYYYILQDGKYVDSTMYQCRKVIDDEYKNYIRLANDRKWPMTNTIFILDDEGSMEEETKFNLQYNINDVIIGSKQIINNLSNMGYPIYECCDISLRSYLSLLYLKVDNFTLNLGVKDSKLEPIPNQMFLDKIDKLSKNKHIVELEGLIDLSQQIVQIYYNPNLSKKVNTFHNGVLIYHQNRLISRYKYPLGTLLQHIDKFNPKSYNVLPIFGYIELPKTYLVNSFKTNFLMDSMIEYIDSRIKLASKSLRRKLSKTTTDTKNKKKSNQQQEIKNQGSIEESHPRKITKLNQGHQ